MKEGDGTDERLHRTVQQYIDKCPNLTHVVLHGLSLPEETGQYLQHLPVTVKSLDLSHNWITDDEMAAIITSCPNMETVDLSGTTTTTITVELITENGQIPW